jgi:rhodanese-related sulfurtransferase
MKKWIISCCIFFFAAVIYAQDSTAIQVLEPEVYKLKVESSPQQFVDVRTPQEYNSGYIAGAENIDFKAEGFLSKMEKFDKNEPVYIYCRSGNRSSKAAAQLSEIGFTNIIDLKGGYKAWKEIEEEQKP